MTKRKAKQEQTQPPDSIQLGKPDFEQALSFAQAPVAAATPAVAQENAAQAGGHPGPTAAGLMPQDAATRKILQARARMIAKRVDQRQQAQRSQYLRFRLGPVERYGIPYQYLEELLYVSNLARVPCTPAFVLGVANHRGELLSILDLKQFFRVPATTPGEEARIVVVRHAGMRVGLLVDGVDGNEEYQDAELSAPLSSEGVAKMEHVLGIHAGGVTLLNMAAFLEDPALLVNR